MSDNYMITKKGGIFLSYGHRGVYAHSVRNSRVSRYYNSSDRNKILEERKRIKDDSKADSSYDKKLASANITNNTALYGSKKTNLDRKSVV